MPEGDWCEAASAVTAKKAVAIARTAEVEPSILGKVLQKRRKQGIGMKSVDKALKRDWLKVVAGCLRPLSACGGKGRNDRSGSVKKVRGPHDGS
jgi:hypothetical protein